jgi:hypothetical protein
MIHDAFVIVVAVSLEEKEYCRAVFYRTVASLSKWTFKPPNILDIKTSVIS